MEKSRDAYRRRREEARREREVENARCLVCGKPASLEDRCQDGNYLHRECAARSSWR